MQKYCRLWYCCSVAWFSAERDGEEGWLLQGFLKEEHRRIQNKLELWAAFNKRWRGLDHNPINIEIYTQNQKFTSTIRVLHPERVGSWPRAAPRSAAG
ncbi:unnamed protein product [Linum tenue]|uniref:Uncharacterized protein n=1 Tax=Linum tenue TaxID=586396 RepID=A0AAV0JB51_9ROSI|nr:unnamed protein product [Linum tenue]